MGGSTCCIGSRGLARFSKVGISLMVLTWTGYAALSCPVASNGDGPSLVVEFEETLILVAAFLVREENGLQNSYHKRKGAFDFVVSSRRPNKKRLQLGQLHCPQPSGCHRAHIVDPNADPQSGTLYSLNR